MLASGSQHGASQGWLSVRIVARGVGGTIATLASSYVGKDDGPHVLNNWQPTSDDMPMPSDKPLGEQVKFMVQMPRVMRELMTQAAKSHNRPVNEEIIARLEKSLARDDVLAELTAKIHRIEVQLRDLLQDHQDTESASHY